MSIRNIRRQATNPLAAPGTATSAPIYVDSDDNKLKMIPAGSGTTEVDIVDVSSTQTLTNKTVTAPTLTAVTITGASTITGATLVNSLVTSAPINAGSTLSVTAALHAGKTILLDQVAGTVNTLPAATGTGNVYTFIGKVALTSVSNIWNAVGSDKISGGILINNTGDTVAATADFWPATAASSVTLTGTLAAGGGSIGDRTVFVDIASAIWAVTGMWTTAIDPVSPFS